MLYEIIHVQILFRAFVEISIGLTWYHLNKKKNQAIWKCAWKHLIQWQLNSFPVPMHSKHGVTRTQSHSGFSESRQCAAVRTHSVLTRVPPHKGQLSWKLVASMLTNHGISPVKRNRTWHANQESFSIFPLSLCIFLSLSSLPLYEKRGEGEREREKKKR